MAVHQIINRNLSNFYLDPNNYRFVDNDNYIPVAADKITDEITQKRVRYFIEGTKRDGVKDLLDSFKANGFLGVDAIQVKDLGDNHYLVLEGNRRITALKILQDEYSLGLNIGKLDPAIFESVPSTVYTDEDSAHHLIVMGLKHISGNKKWPAINQAKLIYDYLKDYNRKDAYWQEETKLCKSLGITKHKLRSSQRAYLFILQYQASDYGDQFDRTMYSTFAEVTKTPSIKNWLEWHDGYYRADHKENKQRLFKWLSETEDPEEEHDEEGMAESTTRPAIITKYREIQDLARFIDNEKALEVMEASGSVAQGLLSSGTVDKQSCEENIDKLRNSVSELIRLKDLLQTDQLDELKVLNKKFNRILPAVSALDIQIDNIKTCFEKGHTSHFSTIEIEKYKVFDHFKITGLQRINLFAGFNNSGKTTLLEAIYLLTKQNDISALFELTRLKNKLDTLSTDYLNSHLDQTIAIKGQFNQVTASANISKFQATDIDQKDDYIASYQIQSSIDGDALKTKIHTFKYNPLQRYSDNVEVLCHSIFKSPYFYNRNEVISTHSKNIELKVYKQIIAFLKDNIDGKINAIEFTEDDEIKRFLVDSSAFAEKSVDITNYGEGLQRVFEISLAFAYCKNGILLIDELETAIHQSLLIDFTRFIQTLAVEFNVQVFITSHSKECIDAFVNNDFNNEEIAAYFLENSDGTIEATCVDGEKLKYYIENIGFDLRGSGDE